MGHAAEVRLEKTWAAGDDRRTFREVVTFTDEQRAHLRLMALSGAISLQPLGSIDWRKHRRRGWKQRRSAGWDRRR